YVSNNDAPTCKRCGSPNHDITTCKKEPNKKNCFTHRKNLNNQRDHNQIQPNEKRTNRRKYNNQHNSPYQTRYQKQNYQPDITNWDDNPTQHTTDLSQTYNDQHTTLYSQPPNQNSIETAINKNTELLQKHMEMCTNSFKNQN